MWQQVGTYNLRSAPRELSGWRGTLSGQRYGLPRLPPGRYVGLPEEEDDFNFEERFTALKAEFEEQLKEEDHLYEIISANFSKIKMKQ